MATNEPALRFLTRAQVLNLVPVSFPTIWYWMRQNNFPRSRQVGGSSRALWLEHEVLAWIAAQPVKKLKPLDIKTFDAQPVKKLKPPPPDEKPKVTKRRRAS
jgi:predicted DNA-binding transcriptional regulator AlpA